MEVRLYRMSVRAYDPSLGRFIARDPLGRAPLMGWTTQPYAYAGNNLVLNVDPSGQRIAGAVGAQAQAAVTQYQRRAVARAVRDSPLHEWRHADQAMALGSLDIGGWTEKVRALRALGREDDARRAYEQERAARRVSGVLQWMPRGEMN